MTSRSFGRYEVVLPGMAYAAPADEQPRPTNDIALTARVRYEEPEHLYRRLASAARRIDRTLMPDIRRMKPTEAMVLRVGLLDDALLNSGYDLIKRLSRGAAEARRVFGPTVAVSNERRPGGVDCLYLQGGRVPRNILSWAKTREGPKTIVAVLDMALWDREIVPEAWCANIRIDEHGLTNPPDIISAYRIGKPDLLNEAGQEEVGRAADELYQAFATRESLSSIPDISAVAEESYLARVVRAHASE